MATLSQVVATPDLPHEVSKHIPQTALSKTALSFAHQTLPQPIFNHSLRVFLLSKWLAESESGQSSEWIRPEKLDLLFVACIFHDMGASDLYNGKQRFEVEGADAANAYLHAHSISRERGQEVWVAIALHTSPGIAERITPLARLVRLGVRMDFTSQTRDELRAQGYSAEIEVYLPRLEIEKVLGDVVVKQAVEIPEKAPAASWPSDLLKAHLADPVFEGVNRGF